MRITTLTSRAAIATLALLALGAPAADRFDPSTNLLELDTIAVGSASYRQVRVTVNAYTLLGVDGGNAQPNRFDTTSQLLSLGAISYLGQTYNNVRAQIDRYTVLSATAEGIGSNYITSRAIIPPTLGASVPAKGESRIDPVTGVRITRLTDVKDFGGATNNALIVYSRYSPESSDGKYVLIHGYDSNSSWVVERETFKVISELKGEDGYRIGENQEVRWDYTGSHPKRVYFRKGMKFYQIDDISSPLTTRSLVKDFSSISPNSTEILNDVEGDSTSDSDHWIFMARRYDTGLGRNVVDMFIHFQKSTGLVHTLKPSDLDAAPASAQKERGLVRTSKGTAFVVPNMVDMAPDGSGIVLLFAAYQSPMGWFDRPHLWPLDLDWQKKTPLLIGMHENHSGWAFGADGRAMFVIQNSSTDNLDASYTTGANAGHQNVVEVAKHGDFGWENGFHYGRMPLSRKGWIFVNTYATENTSGWANNQMFMIQAKPKASTPKVWRIGPNYNAYRTDPGNGEKTYREEAPAAINLFGNRIYVGINWGGQLDHLEVFQFDLPDNWTEAPELQ